MSPRWARLWYAATALCAAAAVALNVVTAVQTPGHFHSGVERAFNTFAFFTIQSNLLVGATALPLALRLERTSMVFRTFRLIALASITVTGIVYHVALSGLLTLGGLHQLANQLAHTVVPLLAVAGWLAAGPRGQTSARIAWLTPLYPLCWLAFTLIRGAVIGWYPYPFIDVTQLGYAKTILNCVWVALLFLGLAAAATALDTCLTSRAAAGEPQAAPAEPRRLGLARGRLLGRRDYAADRRRV